VFTNGAPSCISHMGHFTGPATLFTWHFRDLEPPPSTAPNGAVDYLRLAKLDKVFNSYDFGGYLIFLRIPTYVDGRAAFTAMSS